MPREEIDTFFKLIPPGFADPLTGIHPASERELSAVLMANHQFKALRWPKIPLWRGFAREPTERASSIISPDDYVFSEYPLFAQLPHHVDRWGAMAPDLVFLSTDKERVTLVECKVDSHFTHGDGPPSGQLSRYLEFLSSIAAKSRNLLMICPECNHEWYAKRLMQAVDHAASLKVVTFMARWEHVFQAIES